MSGDVASRYREVAVKTSTPLQIVVLSYDAAICSLQEARGQMDRRDVAGRSRSIRKALATIGGLQSCLDVKAGGEIASSLYRLYDYMKRRIFEANVTQTPEPLAEVQALLEDLRTAWKELATQGHESDLPANPPALPRAEMVNREAPALNVSA